MVKTLRWLVVDYIGSKINWWFCGSILGLSGATFLTYWPTLNYPFQFDDLMNITKNYAIRAYNLRFDFLRSSRWIGELSNKLNFKLGHFQPWTYRLVNIGIHLCTGLLLFYLIYKLCQQQPRFSFLRNWSTTLAFLSAVLFLLHPVQSQTVNYAIQARLEGLAALFTLATLALFANWLIAGNALRLFATCLCGFLACGTKEVVVVLPALALLLDWFFIARQDWSVFKKHLWGHALLALTVFGTIAYYLGIKFFSNALTLQAVAKNNRGNIVSSGILNQINAFEYLMSQFKVVVHYLSIFILPQSICVEYDWKLATSFWRGDVVLPLLFLSAIASTTVYLLWQKRASEFCFSALWFFVCLAPRSSIVPCAELVCDYKTYLASCGMMFLLAFVATKIISHFTADINFYMPQKALQSSALFIITAAPLAWATTTRNLVWSSSENFWHDIVIKAPGKARANNNYAVAMCEKGKFLDAIPYFKKAITLDKIYCDPWSNLAVAYSMIGQHDQALKALQQAIVIFPEYPEAFNNLGAMLLNNNDLEKAEEALNKAVALRPHYGKAYLNLGRLHTKKNDNEKSFAFYKKATQTDLDNIEGFSCLGFEALRLGKFDEAVKALEKAVNLGANSPALLANLAGAYCNTKNNTEGMRIFKKLHQHNPHDPVVTYNLALCYQTEGQPQQAINLLQTIKLEQNTPECCISLLAECVEKTDGLEKAKSLLQDLCAKELPEKHKKMAQAELTRVTFQEKINKNGGVLTGKDLQEAFGQTADTSKA